MCHGVCVCVCATCYVGCVFGRVFGCVSSYVCLRVCISVCVYVCMPVTLWEQERMKHAQVKQGKPEVHVNRSRTRQTKGLENENDTTTVANTTGCPRRCVGAPWNSRHWNEKSHGTMVNVWT